MNTTELAIIGLGGVGGYFGFKLATHYAGSPAVRITFLARGQTYEAVRQNGLTLLSAEHENAGAHPFRLVAEPGELAPADIILICVKNYDLEPLCRQLQAVIRPGTVLLPLMNGVDIQERISALLPTAVVLPACVYVASHLKACGVVEHKGNPGKIIFGPDPGHPAYDARPVLELLRGAGIDADYQPDPLPAIWLKFLFIASFGLVSARYNQPIGAVLAEPELQARARRLVLEMTAIARAKGVALPDDSPALVWQKAASFPYHTPTSLQLDVHSGRPHTELELFAGAVLAYGRRLGLPVVETRKIYQEIKSQLAQRVAKQEH